MLIASLHFVYTTHVSLLFSTVFCCMALAEIYQVPARYRNDKCRKVCEEYEVLVGILFLAIFSVGIFVITPFVSVEPHFSHIPVWAGEMIRSILNTLYELLEWILYEAEHPSRSVFRHRADECEYKYYLTFKTCWRMIELFSSNRALGATSKFLDSPVTVKNKLLLCWYCWVSARIYSLSIYLEFKPINLVKALYRVFCKKSVDVYFRLKCELRAVLIKLSNTQLLRSFVVFFKFMFERCNFISRIQSYWTE